MTRLKSKISMQLEDQIETAPVSVTIANTVGSWILFIHLSSFQNRECRIPPKPKKKNRNHCWPTWEHTCARDVACLNAQVELYKILKNHQGVYDTSHPRVEINGVPFE
jgi:hypothetical protein